METPWGLVEDERPCQVYDCSYQHDGSTWGVRITAYDWDDARERVAKLGSLRLEGELVATVRCTSETAGTAGFLIGTWCNLVNHVLRFFRRP